MLIAAVRVFREICHRKDWEMRVNSMDDVQWERSSAERGESSVRRLEKPNGDSDRDDVPYGNRFTIAKWNLDFRVVMRLVRAREFDSHHQNRPEVAHYA